MSEKRADRNGRAFSIELKSMRHVERIAMPYETDDGVLIEGFLGNAGELSLVEGVMLEVRGDNGVVRIEMGEEELRGLAMKGEKTRP